MNALQNQINTSTTQQIEHREIGEAVDGMITESLIIKNGKFLLVYIVWLDKETDGKKFRRIAMVEASYEIARMWYELRHPKGAFQKLYKPS